jgi:glycolate oxidase FAD binding subunit
MSEFSLLAENWPELFTGAITPSTQIRDMVAPVTSDELCVVVQKAAQQQQKILVAGSGSKINWGGLVTEPTLLIRTSRLDRLIDHAVGDLTVTVEAGITFQQLQQQLALAGQFLPLDPLFPDRSTIGGLIATADTGSLRHRYGGVRDLLLGIHWVRADGVIAKAGGRVVKNVAGYDLMKLFTGSYGTLGILQQVTLRVYPLPVASGSVWVTGAALSDLIGQLGAMTLTPTALDLISAGLAQQLGLGEQMGLLARFQTIPESIQVQSQQLVALAASLGLTSQVYAGEPETKIWGQVRPIVMTKPITAKIGVRATATVEFLTNFSRQTNGWGVLHVGSGIGLIGGDESELNIQALMPLRQQCEQAGGFLTILTAPAALKQQLEVWGYQGAAVQIMRQLRQQFDSQALFNPGKLFT